MAFTNTKDVSFQLATRSIQLRFHASYYREAPRWYDYTLQFTDPYACCGMRVLSGFDVFTQNKELQSADSVSRLQGVLRSAFAGGNVSFILNERQKKQCKTLLGNMKKLGGLRTLKVHNHTYGHGTITLFVWTLKGKK